MIDLGTLQEKISLYTFSTPWKILPAFFCTLKKNAWILQASKLQTQLASDQHWQFLFLYLRFFSLIFSTFDVEKTFALWSFHHICFFVEGYILMICMHAQSIALLLWFGSKLFEPTSGFLWPSITLVISEFILTGAIIAALFNSSFAVFERVALRNGSVYSNKSILTFKVTSINQQWSERKLKIKNLMIN